MEPSIQPPSQSEERQNWRDRITRDTFILTAIGVLLAALMMFFSFIMYLLPLREVTDSPFKKFFPDQQPLEPPQQDQPPQAKPPESINQQENLTPQGGAADTFGPQNSKKSRPVAPYRGNSEENEHKPAAPYQQDSDGRIYSIDPEQSDTEDTIELTSEIEVTDDPYFAPSRARPLRRPWIVEVPSDALSSFLAGRQITSRVDIDLNGDATVFSVQSPPGTPSYIVENVIREIELSIWEPARNDYNQTVEDTVTVLYQCKRSGCRQLIPVIDYN